MRDLFLSSDVNTNGSLDREEFQICMSKLNSSMNSEEIDDLFDLLDANKDGNIN